VMIDGLPAGKTPLERIQVAAGTRAVRVGGTCYVETFEKVDVVPGEERRISVAPVLATVELEVKPQPGLLGLDQAEVLVDGRRLGEMPGRFTVPACSKVLEVRPAKAEAYKQVLWLVGKRLNSVEVAPGPGTELPPGILTVHSVPPGVPILLDGAPLGITPLDEQTLPPGVHDVRVEGLCHAAAQEMVRVEPAREHELVMTLHARETELEVTVRDDQGKELAAEVLEKDQVLGVTPGSFRVSQCTFIRIRRPKLGLGEQFRIPPWQYHELVVVWKDGEAKANWQPAHSAKYLRPDTLVSRRIGGAQPSYPMAARVTGQEATLVVRILLTPDGRVSELDFLTGDPMFNEEVARALSNWRFSPYLVDGQAVGTYTVYKFVFKLDP